MANPYNLSAQDWTEIFNCGISEELQDKLTEETTEQPELTRLEYLEIHRAVEGKLESLKDGGYGNDALTKHWAIDMEALLDSLAPVVAATPENARLILAEAEAALGTLSDGQRVDLLMDNTCVANTDAALALVLAVANE